MAEVMATPAVVQLLDIFRGEMERDWRTSKAAPERGCNMSGSSCCGCELKQ